LNLTYTAFEAGRGGENDPELTPQPIYYADVAMREDAGIARGAFGNPNESGFGGMGGGLGSPGGSQSRVGIPKLSLSGQPIAAPPKLGATTGPALTPGGSQARPQSFARESAQTNQNIRELTNTIGAALGIGGSARRPGGRDDEPIDDGLPGLSLPTPLPLGRTGTSADSRPAVPGRAPADQPPAEDGEIKYKIF